DVHRVDVERHGDEGTRVHEERVLRRRRGQWKGIAAELAQGVGEPSGRVQQGHQIPEGRYLAEAFGEVEDGLLVEDAVRAATDRACFALGLPRDSDARRQIVPIPVREGLRYSGIAEIEEARRRVLVYAAFGPRCIRGLIEVNAYAVLVVLGQQRLPAHA